jgi:hypothetical protein
MESQTDIWWVAMTPAPLQRTDEQISTLRDAPSTVGIKYGASSGGASCLSLELSTTLPIFESRGVKLLGRLVEEYIASWPATYKYD